MELQSDFNQINHLLVSDDKIEIAFTENMQMNGGKSKQCSPGQILKKGYHRKSYTRKDGTRVSETDVSSACIKDRGALGKGPYTLPREPLEDKEVSLRQYGYSVHASDRKRHDALNKASKATDALLVYRHLNLLTNYQADPQAKKIMRSDVEYMKEQYQKIREKQGPSKRSYKERSQMGGFSETSPMATSCGQYGGFSATSPVASCGQYGGFSDTTPMCGQYGGQDEIGDSEDMEGGNNHEQELYKIFAKAREYRERVMKGGQQDEIKKRAKNPLLMVAIGLAKDLKSKDKYSKTRWTQLVKFANQVIRDSKKLLNISDKTSIDDEDIKNIEKKSKELISDDKYMKDLIELDKQLEKHEPEDTPNRIRNMWGGQNYNFY